MKHSIICYEGLWSIHFTIDLISCRYFTGLLSPWKGILLFGHPGTGMICICSIVSNKLTLSYASYLHNVVVMLDIWLIWRKYVIHSHVVNFRLTVGHNLLNTVKIIMHQQNNLLYLGSAYSFFLSFSLMLVSIWITILVADNASKGCCNRMQDHFFQYFSIICSQQMAWYVKNKLSKICLIVEGLGPRYESYEELSLKWRMARYYCNL